MSWALLLLDRLAQSSRSAHFLGYGNFAKYYSESLQILGFHEKKAAYDKEKKIWKFHESQTKTTKDKKVLMNLNCTMTFFGLC